jgi:hypothetical protein
MSFWAFVYIRPTQDKLSTSSLPNVPISQLQHEILSFSRRVFETLTLRLALFYPLLNVQITVFERALTCLSLDLFCNVSIGEK